MKKLFTVFACILFAASVFAQAPNKMSYQSVIRNSSNELISNQKVGVRISILQGTTNGTTVYVESQTPVTNSNGLISIEIGSGTTISGTFSLIDWSKGPYFIKSETDPNGGSNYSITGTSQLLSVPYALYAESSGNSLPGPQGLPGEQGPAGLDGQNGLSAYELWLSQGNTGELNDFIASIKGGQGSDGLSAYEIWINQGNTGDEDDFLASMKGEQGPEGLLQEGTEAGNTPYWDGNKWVIDDGNLYNSGEGIGIGTNTPDPSAKLDVSSNLQGFLMPRMTTEQRDAIELPAQGLLVYNLTLGSLEINDGTSESPVWTSISGIKSISGLDCEGATINGVFKEGETASGINTLIPYTGGSGGTYSGQTISSTGVTGLTASLSSGNFTTGDGSLTFQISGTPNEIGTASFSISVGGQSCVLNIPVMGGLASQYSSGAVFCDGPTEIVEVTSSATGQVWMDRNLGAKRAATSSTDQDAYGDLYQWGRGADGHQCRNSTTISSRTDKDQPEHGDFILTSATPHNWRSPSNDNLWQGVNGINNPCPSGFRLPTRAEMDAEVNSWPARNAAAAFDSPLKLPMAASRVRTTGVLNQPGEVGWYWTSSLAVSSFSGLLSPNESFILQFGPISASVGTRTRTDGASVRCIKD